MGQRSTAPRPGGDAHAPESGSRPVLGHESSNSTECQGSNHIPHREQKQQQRSAATYITGCCQAGTIYYYVLRTGEQVQYEERIKQALKQLLGSLYQFGQARRVNSVDHD